MFTSWPHTFKSFFDASVKKKVHGGKEFWHYHDWEQPKQWARKDNNRSNTAEQTPCDDENFTVCFQVIIYFYMEISIYKIVQKSYSENNTQNHSSRIFSWEIYTHKELQLHRKFPVQQPKQGK